MDSAMKSVKEFLRNPPSPSTMFNAYASLSGSIMILQSSPNPLPLPIRSFLWSKIQQYFIRHRSRSIGFITVEEYWGAERNLLYSAAEVYLPTKLSPASLTRVKMGKIRSQKNISVALHEGKVIVDTFNNVKITWLYVCTEQTEQTGTSNDDDGLISYSSGKRYFELSFDSEHREEIASAYLQHVMTTAALLEQRDKELKISSYSQSSSTYLQHPATFDTIALDPALKQSIIDDLDRFLARREYYKRIGKTWKRGYLLYGPPGTGKSSLVVAMAKYLKYDVYELDLRSIYGNSLMRNVFLNIPNKSIIVIEDVDCYEQAQTRSNTIDDDFLQLPFQKDKRDASALSGLLNATDGLWSGCGEERIIIFTTNHKDKIDPALLRPGRMDMHIELSYLKASAFPVLAYNYLGLRDGDNPLLEEIQNLLEYTEVTPASVAEELLRSDDVNVALEGVVELLKQKKTAEVNDGEDEGAAAKKRKLSETTEMFS